ncbi:50S ribosomal protein L17 [bacterium AB1]|nr:50S ribosomal protein L17 [bacterium AB1]
MKHAIFYKKLSRDSSHRKSLIKNLTKNLFEYKSITTTKPKAVCLLSFCGKFITRLLKQTNRIEAIKYIKKVVSGTDKRSIQFMLSFYDEKQKNVRLSNYVQKQRVFKIRSDSAVMMNLKLL